MSEPMTLMDVLSPDFEKLPLALVAGMDNTPELASLKALLMLKFHGPQWASMVRGLAGRVGDLLRIPVTTILARAWNELRDVQKAIEQTRQSPDRTEVVALADHTIDSEHKPYLDLYENGQRVGRIVFSVAVAIDLRGLLLEIAGGSIRRIESGDARIRATVKLGDFIVLEKDFERLRIPGEIRFDQPSGGAAGANPA